MDGRRRILAVGIMLGIALGAVRTSRAARSSQPPTPTSGPQRQEQQDQGRAENQTAKPTSLTPATRTSQAVAPLNQPKGPANTREPEGGAPEHWWVSTWPTSIQAIAAVVSAGFTAAIYFVYLGQRRIMLHQSNLMRRGLIETRKAANAAEASADVARDALYLTESADIQLQETVFDLDNRPHAVYPESMPDACLTVKWRNFGRTTAKNVLLDLNFGIPGPGQAKTPFPPNPPVMLAPNQTYPYGFQPMRDIMSPLDLAAVVGGTSALRLWGTVSYDTVFNKRRTLRFGATWNRNTDSFRWDDYQVTETDAPKEG